MEFLKREYNFLARPSTIDYHQLTTAEDVNNIPSYLPTIVQSLPCLGYVCSNHPNKFLKKEYEKISQYEDSVQPLYIFLKLLFYQKITNLGRSLKIFEQPPSEQAVPVY